MLPRYRLVERRRQLRQDMAGLGATGTLPPLPAPTERDLLIAALYLVTDPRPAQAKDLGARCVLAMSWMAELATYAQCAPCGGVLLSDRHQGQIVLAVKPYVLDEVLTHLAAFPDGAICPLILDEHLGDYRPLSDDERAQARTLVED